VAKAARELGLKHVVITSVTRDDLPDGGAGHFAAVVAKLRQLCPAASIEILIPDFQGDSAALQTVLDSRPDILNHNVETVPELYDRIRPQAVLERSLELLRRVKSRAAGILSKSGFMLGLGESDQQVLALLKALRDAECDLVTIGQYLQPSAKHYPVQEYVHPDKFKEFKDFALAIGIPRVASGPLVRSSYHAGEDYAAFK
jgi:lipoic acid synthetase